MDWNGDSSGLSNELPFLALLSVLCGSSDRRERAVMHSPEFKVRIRGLQAGGSACKLEIGE